MFGQVRKHLGEIFHELAKQKGGEIVEGHLMADHVHMCLRHSAEVCGLQRGWIYQRQECDFGCEDFQR